MAVYHIITLVSQTRIPHTLNVSEILFRFLFLPYLLYFVFGFLCLLLCYLMYILRCLIVYFGSSKFFTNVNGRCYWNAVCICFMYTLLHTILWKPAPIIKAMLTRNSAKSKTNTNILVCLGKKEKKKKIIDFGKYYVKYFPYIHFIFMTVITTWCNNV